MRAAPHREKPAADSDRQRCAVHGSVAAVSPGDVLGGAGEADSEDGSEGEVTLALKTH
jgi:hypothetical protein